MKRHGLGSGKELYAEFIARVTNYVLSKKRIPIVWEGFSKDAAHLISRDVVVMAWESEYYLPDKLVEDGFTVINCAWKPLYIVPGAPDWKAVDIMNWNVYNFQNFAKHSPATLNPFNLQPTEKIIGAQLCAWEAPFEYEINFVIENLAALSERVWSVERQCSDEEFVKKFRVLQKKVFRLIQER